MVLWFPPNHGNSERCVAQAIYLSCEKPHTCYMTNIRSPVFISLTHYTPKIKLIGFHNELGKISPLRFDGRCTTCATEGDRMMYALPLHDENITNNRFTQNTSLK